MFFIKILKGIIVGIAAILPGLSGGMLAASMDIYKDLIEVLNDFIKTPFKAIKRIWHYLIGIFIGICIGFVFIAILYTYIPIPTTFLFIGIILSSIPKYIKKINIKTFDIKQLITIIITILIILSTLIIKPTNKDLSTNFFILIIIGILIGLSMIVPGLSGTMILMILGFYQPLIIMIKDFLTAVLTLDFFLIRNNILYILTLGLSGLFSLILLAKLVNYIIKNNQRYFDIAVFSIVIISPFTIIYSLYFEDNKIFIQTSWYVYLISFILLILGLFFGSKLNMKKDIT